MAKTWVVSNHHRCVEHRVSCHKPSLAPATRRVAASTFVTQLGFWIAVDVRCWHLADMPKGKHKVCF